MEKYPFQALGFAYVIIGLWMSYPFFNGLSSTGLVLATAGVILLLMVEIETRRGDRPAT